MRAILVTLCVLATASLVGGCAPVRPWERGALLARCMAPSLDPLETAMDLHVHTTRESAQGAVVGAGAACGCN